MKVKLSEESAVTFLCLPDKIKQLLTISGIILVYVDAVRDLFKLRSVLHSHQITALAELEEINSRCCEQKQ